MCATQVLLRLRPMNERELFMSDRVCVCATQVVLRVRPMNERELFTSDETVVHIDAQDPQQMQVRGGVCVKQ